MLSLMLRADDKIMIKENGRILVTIRIPNSDRVDYRQTKLCFEAPKSIEIIRGKAKKQARMLKGRNYEKYSNSR